VRNLAIGIICLLVVGVFSNGYAAGPIGPPEGFANDDRWVAVGAGFFGFETEWEPEDKTAFPSEGKIGQNIGFLHAGHVSFEAGEGFIRIGAADLTESDGAFEGDFAPMASVGIKGLWFGDTGRRRRSAFGCGPILQGSYHLEYEDKQVPLGIGGTAAMKIKNYWDATLAFGLQYRLNEKFLVFGGPFGYYSQAKTELSSSVLGELSTKIEAKNNIGGYAGVRFTPKRGWILEAEGQFLSDISGGVTLIYTF
jgi:hypothetical protein